MLPGRPGAGISTNRRHARRGVIAIEMQYRRRRTRDVPVTLRRLVRPAIRGMSSNYVVIDQTAPRAARFRTRTRAECRQFPPGCGSTITPRPWRSPKLSAEAHVSKDHTSKTSGGAPRPPPRTHDAKAKIGPRRSGNSPNRDARSEAPATRRYDGIEQLGLRRTQVTKIYIRRS